MTSLKSRQIAVKDEVVSCRSGSGLPVDWASVTFEAVLEELSFWPLLPLLTVGEVIVVSETIQKFCILIFIVLIKILRKAR